MVTFSKNESKSTKVQPFSTKLQPFCVIYRPIFVQILGFCYFCNMEQLYHTLDAFFAPGILLGMALCFVFLHIPPKAALRNYRRARYIMGSAYLLYAICIYLEYHVFEANNDNTLTRPIILTIACYQAFLFTYTLITLIRINHVTLHKLVIEGSIITGMSVGLFIATIGYGSHAALWAFWLYVAFYLVMLAHFVRVFYHEHKHYASLMDNFYTDDDSRRMHWVKRSFLVSLGIGILALFYALLPVPAAAFMFMVVAIVFYATFGVRFINYALHFHSIESAITNEVSNETPQPASLELMQRIDALMQQDHLYRKCDLSVSDIAQRLGEQPRAISEAINANRQINFKTYINELRVTEAKVLLDEDKSNSRTIDAIATEAGFSNRSSFYRVFKRSQGISPTDYRLSR